MAIGDKEAAALIRATYAELDWWAVRGRKDERPERGSDLEGDGTLWPYLPLWDVAHWCVVAAVDHLNLARAALEAGRGPGTAEFTALRGAVVGGARAVWLLAPDDRNVRQQRALRVVHEWYRGHLEWMSAHDAAALDEPTLERRATVMEHTLNRSEQARELWQPADGCPPPSKRNQDPIPRQTDVIRDAAGFTWRDPGKAEAVLRVWRLTSGDAHVLSWPNATRTQAVQRPDTNDVAVMLSWPHLEDLAEAFLAGYGLAKRGWALWDQRAESNV